MGERIMLIAALILFAIAVAGGLTMAVLHFRGQKPPPAVPVFHGLFALAGLLVLLLAIWPDFSGITAWAFGLFLLAALGGLTILFGFRRRGKALPSAMVVGHGLLAVIALLLLLVGVFNLVV
jgi:hypothetical protein